MRLALSMPRRKNVAVFPEILTFRRTHWLRLYAVCKAQGTIVLREKPRQLGQLRNLFLRLGEFALLFSDDLLGGVSDEVGVGKLRFLTLDEAFELGKLARDALRFGRLVDKSLQRKIHRAEAGKLRRHRQIGDGRDVSARMAFLSDSNSSAARPSSLASVTLTNAPGATLYSWRSARSAVIASRLALTKS